jgi:hypothetical protein
LSSAEQKYLTSARAAPAAPSNTASTINPRHIAKAPEIAAEIANESVFSG